MLPTNVPIQWFPNLAGSQCQFSLFFSAQPAATILDLSKSHKIQDDSTPISWDFTRSKTVAPKYHKIRVLSSLILWVFTRFKMAVLGGTGRRCHWGHPTAPLWVHHNVLRHHNAHFWTPSLYCWLNHDNKDLLREPCSDLLHIPKSVGKRRRTISTVAHHLLDNLPLLIHKTSSVIVFRLPVKTFSLLLAVDFMMRLFHICQLPWEHVIERQGANI